MKMLVLNIDRDDDFGRKAKVKGPIIGIKDNLEAANKLGQADPEDSDLNAIFKAISTYKTLKNEEKNVEIATLTGNIKVGVKSDEILAKQLEEVIEKTEVDNVILITDGAEDEHVLPIVQSRIKITSIDRVSVKQSRELEDAYYRIVKLLDDEKVQKQFLLPIALVLIVWAFFVILDMTASGFGAILFTLGLYLLIRVFRWEKNLAYIWEEIKSGFLTGKLSIYTYSIAFVVLIAFGFVAYTNTNFETDIQLLSVFSFLINIVWGVVIAGLIAIFGRAVDIYVRDKKKPWNYWVAPFSLFAFGFISWAVFSALYNALLDWPNSFDVNPFLTPYFIGYTIAGVMIALIGAVINHYIKEVHAINTEELEREKQTAKMAENN